MIVNITVRTIAIKFDFGWRIDTYASFTPKKNFIENFTSEYAGNGIEDIKILETNDYGFNVDTLRDFETITTSLNNIYKNINQTILNY